MVEKLSQSFGRREGMISPACLKPVGPNHHGDGLAMPRARDLFAFTRRSGISRSRARASLTVITAMAEAYRSA